MSNESKLVTRTCDFCKKGYTGFGKQFCSKKCMGSSKKKNQICIQCKVNICERHSKFFCSYKCRGDFRRGKKVTWAVTRKPGYVSPKKGIKLSDDIRKKMSDTKRSITLYNFKGDDAAYNTKHQWVYLRKGKANQCTNCGKINNRIHWSNVDHKYRRNVDDYVALCAKCHKRYDMENGLTRM